VSYPGTNVGSTDTQDVTVTVGRRAIAIQTSATSPFSDTQAGTCFTDYLGQGLAIPARAACTIRVGYTPTGIAGDSGALTVSPCSKSAVIGGTLACTRVDTTKAQSVQLSGQGLAPDLDIAGIVLGDGVTPQGYVVVVRNVGNGTADLTGVGVQGYYGPTATYNSATGTGACGQSFNNGTTLAAGTTVNITVGCSFAGAVGDKYLVVRVDATGALTESNESNNDLAKGLVDFEIGGITIQGAEGGSNFRHTVTLRNIGAGEYDGSALSRVTSYFSSDGFLDAGDRALDCSVTLQSAIAADSELPIPQPCNSTPRAGEEYLIAAVDAADSQYEARENNNSFAIVLPKADLLIASESVPYTYDGTTLSYSVDIQVDGDLPIESSTVLVAGVWSTDQTYGNSDDNPACNSSMPAGQPSGGEVLAVPMLCLNSGPGTRLYLLIKVDAGSPEAVAESDETNNVRAYDVIN
jgi:hypothetical protein